MRTELLSLEDPAWDASFGDAERDIYHSAGFHRYAQASSEGTAYLFVAGDRRRGLAWPYLVRQVDDIAELAGSTATDVTSVYGYPGPVAWGCRPGDPFLAEAWAQVQAAWIQQGDVAAFTRFNPLLDNAMLLAGVAQSPGAPGLDGVTAIGPTVSIDLTLGHDEIRAGYGRGLRREIEAAREAGLVTEVDEQWAALPTFARLYHETMRRAGAARYYFFDEANLARLRGALGSRIHLLVTRLDDVVASAALFTEFNGIVEWYLVGSDEAFQAISPAKVLVEDAVAWARGRGNRIMHIGGGRGGTQDSLLWFKSRFSPRRHLFHVGRWVLDGAAYRDLAAARRAADPDAARLDTSYFPAYRAPRSAAPEASE